jgi:hypothetical protein
MPPSELITPPSKAALTFLGETLGQSKGSLLSFFRASVAPPMMRQISVVMPKIEDESAVYTILTTHFSKLDEILGSFHDSNSARHFTCLASEVPES